MSNPISEYYHGRDIFVTGGSGLMGKALLEKLLRSCTQLNRIFVLLRDRKGMSAYDRLKKLKENRIFDRLKSEKPNALDKLVAIPGDLIEHDLGMSEESKKSMANVSLIFHVAATIRFDETLRRAILINVRGTREALNFAMQLRNLQRFVHVSTAFSYPYKTRLDEQIYPPMDDWKTIIKLAEKFDDGILNIFTKK
ncbi:unnamed protein product [Hermetia illucens]|uniref:Fatty acyl-CoA reductase n=2 Tax=Hermetia illucens TaxID=343691 RepID=A0A7R8UD34_HERIL|nr:unnamed protein product [Hermetia illucens]